MRTSLRLALVLLLTCAGGRVLAAPAPGCKAAVSQIDMNSCAYQAYQHTDARLNAVYRALLGKASTGGQAQLRDAQRAWVIYRDKQCAFETAGTVDGSVHPMILGYCLEDVTSDQLKRLKAQLHCQEGNLSCGGQ